MIPDFFEPFIIEYDEDRYGFANEMREITNIMHLHYAHKLFDVQLATRVTDQKTKLHEVYYKDSRNIFQSLYFRFLKEIISPRLDLMGGFIYQKVPNLRVHFPESLAVGEFHKDTSYDHNPHEINCWLPLTKVYETNSIWLESYPDQGDYKPAMVMPGECLIFQGGLLTHGNKINKTPFTRMSFDFRVLAPEHYQHDVNKCSVNTSTRMVIGEYFAVMGNPVIGNPERIVEAARDVEL